MAVAKNYRLINFMNREHHPVFLYFLGAIGWLGVLLCGGGLQLASLLQKELSHGHLKSGFRRAGWIARRSWLHADVVNDPFYIFSEGLNLEQLTVISHYLEKRKNKLNEEEYLSDWLMIQAAKIHCLLDDVNSSKPEQQKVIRSLFEEFDQVSTSLLNQLPVSLKDKASSLIKPIKKRKGDFSRKDAIQALQEFSQLLPNTEMPWYIISGTFLGMYRDGGFMAHDYDLDVGLNIEDCDLEKIQTIFKDCNQFVIKKLDHHLEVIEKNGVLELHKKPALIKLVHQTGINLDIFIHHLENEMRWHGSSIHRWDNKEFQLQQGVLEGVNILYPSNPDRYLTENYGDWRTPVTDFDCSTGTPNLVICSNPASVALFIRRFQYSKDLNPNYAIAIKKQLDKAVCFRKHNLEGCIKEIEC